LKYINEMMINEIRAAIEIRIIPLGGNEIRPKVHFGRAAL
jgi:hypothetical protein